MNPAVDISIVIPSYSRTALVVSLVERCLKLDPRPREVIVVDDRSPIDPTTALVGIDPEAVRVIRLPANEGQATARSVGFAAAKGTYLVSLDDDSTFLDGDALDRVWRRFESKPRCGILAFRTFSPGLPVEPSRDKLTRVADHITCGAAYRADVLRQTGYHLGFLRYEGEESDLSVKVINAGFDVLLDDSLRIFHDYDPTSRTRETLVRCRRFAVRNDLLRSWIYFPGEIALGLTVWRSLSHLLFGIKRGFVSATARGYLEFIRHFRRALDVRQPITRSAALRYLRLRHRPEPL